MRKKSVLPPDSGIDKYLPKSLISDTSWSDGNNIHFGKGYIKKVPGWEKWYATSLGNPVMSIDNYFKFNGDAWLIATTTDKIFEYNSATNEFVDITGTPLTGDFSHPVFTESADDWMIFTNGVDKPRYWDGTAATTAVLPGIENSEGGVTDLRAKTMCYTNNFLILGGTRENGVDFPQRIRWSKLGDIKTWHNDVDGNGQAGFADLADGVDWVQRIIPFQNYVIVYKERSLQILSYVGGDMIWDKKPAIIGTGLLAPKAIIDLGSEHIFIGPDNIYSYDLVEVKIAGDDIAKDFFKTLDPAKSNLTCAFFIEEIPEAWFAYVSTNSPDGFHDKAIVYNVDTKKWSIRDMPMTAFGFWSIDNEKTIDQIETEIDDMEQEYDESIKLANAPINLMGDGNGYIYVSSGGSKDGASLPCYADSKVFDLDSPDRIKRLKRIQLMTTREGDYTLDISIGMCDNVDDEIVWYGKGDLPLTINGNLPYTMSLNKSYPPWVDLDLSSRYFIMKIANNNANEPFKLTGYILYYDLRSEL